MKTALIPLKVKMRDIPGNLRRLVDALHVATDVGARLVIFPEMSFTGYISEAEEIESLAEPVPGPITMVISTIVRRLGVYTIFGLIERNEKKFYSTSLVMDPRGNIVSIQRKLSEFDPFTPGDKLNMVELPFGRISILICGDLFYEEIFHMLNPELDFLVVPMARSFDKISPDPLRWLREERDVYRKRVEEIGVLTMFVNLLEEGTHLPSFGGAMVVSGEGKILAESPHGSDEILIYELS